MVKKKQNKIDWNFVLDKISSAVIYSLLFIGNLVTFAIMMSVTTLFNVKSPFLSLPLITSAFGAAIFAYYLFKVGE